MVTQIIQQFKSYLQSVGYGQSTQNMLPVLVMEFLEQQNIKDISYIEQIKVKSFYEYLQSRPLKKRIGILSESMISQYVYALKTFFTWAEITEQIDYNPISGIKFKRPKQNHRQPLTTAEIQLLFTAAETLKETAILHIFYSCGLRRSEGEALNISDIHFKNNLLFVRAGKFNKRRVIPITAKVTEDLESYLSPLNPPRGKPKNLMEDAFFLNSKGERLSGDGCNKIFKILLEKAHGSKLIAQGCSLHNLRHSIATHFLQSGMSIHYVKDFLGHSFLESTQIYAKPKATQLKLL